uniref:Uncharacterized protein n=1 Tax=Arundo donax TaxID=35708 RepID=A0A0A8YLL5_ARUDO
MNRCRGSDLPPASVRRLLSPAPPKSRIHSLFAGEACTPLQPPEPRRLEGRRIDRAPAPSTGPPALSLLALSRSPRTQPASI